MAENIRQIRQLFVARLPWTACRVVLRQYFSQFGAVASTNVVFDQNTGRSKCFGFVIFKDEEGVREAMKVSHHEIHDTEIFVQPSQPRKVENTSGKDLNMVFGMEQN